MELMKQACQRQNLKLAKKNEYNQLKARLYEKPWIIDVRDPVKNPQHVLEYLARYTHRVAISNNRIKSLQNGMVTFSPKNRKKDRMESVSITAVEFIRRFFLHSLPNRSANLSNIRQLMRMAESSDQTMATVKGIIYQLTGIDITVCPVCQKGKMQPFGKIPK